MNEKKTSWWLVVGGGILVDLLLVACLALRLTGPTVSGGYRSNGEQIYFTATSQRGTPITSDTGMMSTFVAPDIRYKTLTSEEMEHEGEEAHPPYTDETIKRAITQGVDPAGDSLEWRMPRWRMSDQDLDDSLEFLKTLDGED